MPYTLSNQPDIIKNLPIAAKRIWIKAFNSSYKKGEEYARKIAWEAIKKSGFKKVNNKWKRWEL